MKVIALDGTPMDTCPKIRFGIEIRAMIDRLPVLLLPVNQVGQMPWVIARSFPGRCTWEDGYSGLPVTLQEYWSQSGVYESHLSPGIQ